MSGTSVYCASVLCGCLHMFTVPVFFVYGYRLTCSMADMGVEIAHAQLKYFLLYP